MSTQDAIKIVEQMRQQFTGAGKDHDIIREAIMVLARLAAREDAPAPAQESPKQINPISPP